MNPEKRSKIFEALSDMFSGAASMGRGAPKALKMIQDPSFRQEAIEIGAEILGRVGKQHFEKFLGDLLERMRKKGENEKSEKS